jgi:hypothetical protein
MLTIPQLVTRRVADRPTEVTGTCLGNELVPIGYMYRVVVHLRESAGMAATISAVDLTFMTEATPVISSHQQISDQTSTSTCSPRGTFDTKEFVITDTDPSHPHVTTAGEGDVCRCDVIRGDGRRDGRAERVGRSAIYTLGVA